MVMEIRLEQLAQRWRTQAEDLRRWGAAGHAETLERAASELEQALASQGEEHVGLEEAAVMSGYSRDSLRRLVREGRLRASRRGRRLLFLIADLPKKAPLSVDGPRLAGYDPRADARSVAGRRAHGD
jgi:hypothetical protein